MIKVYCDTCNYIFDSWDDHRYNKFDKLPQVICPNCNKSRSIYDMDEEKDQWYWLCNNCGHKWDYEGPEEFVMCIPAEAVADENNMATVFCPHCAEKLCKPDSCKPVDAA